MEKEHLSGETGNSRRKLLKKAGIASAFVLPTIMTFKISELQAQPSEYPGKGVGPDRNNPQGTY